MRGAAHIEWQGERISLLPSHMLWVDDHRWLVVADLHLGKARHFARMGQFLPPHEVESTLARLTHEVTRLKPQALILLGDTLHSASGLDDGAFARWCAAMGALTTLHLIGGNHDPAALSEQMAELRVPHSGIRLRHAPDGTAAPQIVGHLHPCVTLATRAGKQRRRCFVVDDRQIILPAFGSLTGSMNVDTEGEQRRFFVSAGGQIVPIAG